MITISDYLPPIVARLSFEMGDFISGIAKARAAVKGLNGEMKIDTSGLTAAATKVKALQASLNGLNGTVRVNSDGLSAMATKTVAAGAATAAATGIMINGWRLTGTALHWVIAGGAELAAVTIPAIVALGAGLAVMGPAAQSVQAHMQALNTATSADGQMFGKTAGDVLGLGHALQTAQNAASPSVYGILGSALTVVKERFGSLAGTGLQVSQMLQTFSARVAIDFGPGGGLGGKVSGLLSHMTTDLQGLGQVLGNTGHAFVNFASAMPGLAEVLLKMLSGITGFASHLTGLAGPVIMAAMGFEEFNRWGGLAAQVLTKLGLASASLSGGVFSLQRFASVVQGIASVVPAAARGIAALMAAMGATNGAIGLTKAASGLESLIAKIGPLQAAIGVGAAVGLGILIDKLVTAQSAAQKLGAAMQKSVLSGTNEGAFQATIGNIEQLRTQIAQAAPAAVTAATNFKGLGSVIHNLGQQNVNQLNSALKQQEQDLLNVSQGAASLAKTYKTSLQGALALADLANVKLANGITGTGQAAQIARMQIASLVQGYLAMGQPLGAVGADMTALAIQSGLASAKVSQLNSAWDQFQSNLTGGTSGLASFVQSLANMGTVVANVRNNLGRASGISDSVKQFAQSLTSFGTSGAAAWQNFDQVVGSTAPQLIDWLRTAGAEGAVSAGQFKTAVLGMVSALVPFGSASKTAQAEILGLVQQVAPGISTWNQLKSAIQSSGASLNGTANVIQNATQKMGNMAQVAQNLGNVLQSSILTALSQAKVQASGAGAAMQAYASDLMAGGAAASKSQADYQAVMKSLENLGYSAKQAAALIAQVTANLNSVPKDVTSTIHIMTVGSVPSNYGISGRPSGIPGHAAGTGSAPAGWSWVGEAGPELVKFRGNQSGRLLICCVSVLASGL